jgi:type II secretory pathway pseudopilin PulG
MTLIELLVVIVILMTLVGGVIPVLSPNNDARRIREAARGLQTFVMQAQSHAARTGRPAGIAFRESSPGSGVALDVYQIEVPPPFAGFSQYSASRVRQNLGKPNDIQIQFVLTNTLDTDLLPGNGKTRTGLVEYGIEPIPDKFLKIGDIVVVSGIAYRLIDENHDKEGFYFEEPPNLSEDPQVLLLCQLVDDRQTLAIVEDYMESSVRYGITAPKGYKIFRQPNAVTSSATQPYQLPAGVCIDLQASGTEGGATQTQFATAKPPATTLKQIGILFSPSASIESIYFNGRKFGTNTLSVSPIKDASKVYVLLGRVENGGVSLDKPDPFVVAGGQTGGNTKERIAEIQSRINWMNLDSRWMAIDARNGRTTVSENAFVDPSNSRYSLGQRETVAGIVSMQAQDARQFAREMRRGGER